MASDRGLIASFAACLSATGLGVWSAQEWAALISAGCSVGVLLIHWYYRHKQHKREEAQADEHEQGSA